jgi:hypothetical protein
MMMNPSFSLQHSRVFALSIVAGLIAGGILAGINMALVRPYTSALSETHIDLLLEEGSFDEEEYNAQVQSIYAMQLVGAVALGVGGGTIVGGLYVFGRADSSPLKAAVLIAGIAWFVLYVVPAVKYPMSPQTTFDPPATGRYQMLLLGYTAVSGLSALGIAAGFRKINRKEKAFGAAALYFMIVAGAFFAFPSYEDNNDTSYPQSTISAWRAAIAVALTVFWFALGIICGLLWQYGGSLKYVKK